MDANISTAPTAEGALASLFHTLGQPIRVQILLVIGSGEACVCHLEAHLGERQAVISQHLMLLREAGLVTPHRDGRNIYYRLENPELLNLLTRAAAAAGVDLNALRERLAAPVEPCPCPHCNPQGARQGGFAHRRMEVVP